MVNQFKIKKANSGSVLKEDFWKILGVRWRYSADISPRFKAGDSRFSDMSHTPKRVIQTSLKKKYVFEIYELHNAECYRNRRRLRPDEDNV